MVCPYAHWRSSDTLKEWLYEWNKYHPDQPLYAIKADIHHYFQSIDHAVLKTEIRKVIKDAGVLALLDRIIDHKSGLQGNCAGTHRHRGRNDNRRHCSTERSIKAV